MKFVVLPEIDESFSKKMAQAFSPAFFDQALESGQKLTKEILMGQGLPEDMARTVEAHLDYWQAHKDRGILLEGGPFEGFRKALLVFDASSMEEARELVEKDPYAKGGVFKSYQIQRWHKVL